MADAPKHGSPISGRCLCGAIRITLQQARTGISICHCWMCRRWGGPFAGLGADSFVMEGGEEHVGVYRSSEWAERAFCRTCGSNLWYRFIPGDLHSFLAGLFDLPETFAIDEQIFVDEKPRWYDLAQQTTMKTGAEIIAEAEAMGYSFD